MKRTLVTLLLAIAMPVAAATPGTRTGAFASGERVTPPEPHAPAAVSRTFVKSAVPLGGRVAVDVPAGGSGSLLVLAIPAGERGAARPGDTAAPTLESVLESPGGKRLAPRQTESEDLRRFAVSAEDLGLDLSAAAAEVLHAGRAEAGLWRFSANVPAGVGAVTVVAAEPDSPLAMSTWASPLSRREGEPIVLHAELSDGGAPVAGARVVARLAAPGAPAGAEIPLFDDGRHGDGAADDGVYAAATDGKGLAPGLVVARFDAEGRDARGAAFARTGSGGLMNEPALARLGEVSARFVGAEGDRRLRIAASVDVRQPGDYRLDAIVSGAAELDGSRPGLAWGEATVTLAKGAQRVTLEIPAAQIAGEGVLHVDVRLLGLTTTGLAGRAELDADR